MKISKNIIQGDSYKAKIILKNSVGQEIDPESVSSIYFTCHELNIQKQITYDDELEYYKLELQPSETAQFKVGEFSFDITVIFTATSIRTMVYEGNLLILAKHNPITTN